MTDIPFGRIFRIDQEGKWTLIAEYDGWPNGLKIHRDGRIFITCYKRGIMLLDPDSGAVTPFLETAGSEGFRGVNDLTFAANGDLYFTDQGQTGLQDPMGRVYRLRPSGELTCLIDTVSSPNAGAALTAGMRQASAQAVRWSSGTERPKISVPPNATDCHHHIYDSRFPTSPAATLRPPDATVEDYRALQRRLVLPAMSSCSPRPTGRTTGFWSKQ